VDATVRFLDEFVYEEKKPSQWGRGKAREEEEEKKEDDGVDSFIPMWVYDALKEKKRFDNMRVRSRVCVVSFVTDLRWPTTCRAATRRMPRSSLAST
jgi:hypothetical protein